jgi:hypothetical protein
MSIAGLDKSLSAQEIQVGAARAWAASACTHAGIGTSTSTVPLMHHSLLLPAAPGQAMLMPAVGNQVGVYVT